MKKIGIEKPSVNKVKPTKFMLNSLGGDNLDMGNAMKCINKFTTGVYTMPNTNIASFRNFQNSKYGKIKKTA